MARSSFVLLCLFAVAAAFNQGCNCDAHVQMGCVVDDDCRAQGCAAGTIPKCDVASAQCSCGPDLPLGDVGRWSSLALRGSVAYVCAYNELYRDLMLGHQTDKPRIDNWEFVDGVPTDSRPDPGFALARVRGGISEGGDDVGKYCSLAMQSMDPVISYFDTTNQALRYASFGAVTWRKHVVDQGTAKGPTGDIFGRWTSLTLDKSGNPGIAYYAEVAKGAGGMREGQLRFAQAKVAQPQSKDDWTIVTVLGKPTAVVMMGAEPPVIPEGPAIMVASARKPDDTVAVVFYDNVRGNLGYVDQDAGKKWNAPVVLDGEDAMGNDTADVGQYPSIVFESDATGHISYVDATRDNLLYVNTKTRTPEVADDGYRPNDELTLDGLPAPVFHLVGDSSSVQVAAGTVLIAYQDSTVSQLRLAQRDPMTAKWKSEAVAGHAMPFTGAYGFWAQNRVSGGSAILSSYAINQQVGDGTEPDKFVEIFTILLKSIIM